MGITHLSGLEVAGVPTMGMSGLPLTIGDVYFVDYANGSDGNSGAADAPIKTLYQAQNLMTAGQNDVAVLVGDGSTAATQRLSVANAQTIDPTATTGTLVWAKAACHIVGIAAPTQIGQRARIAPPSGTYTAATFNADVFVSVTAQGCIFSNISTSPGFSTGSASMEGWVDSGGRNSYSNCNLGGFVDTASAQGVGARALLITGSVGENTFNDCVIGTDTIARTVANASLEFAAATPRNIFNRCIFPMLTSAATPLSILGTGAGCVDRFQIFNRCQFINSMSSGGTAQTVIASFTNAAPGGLMLMDQCTFIGDSSTNWGDANALANMYVNGASPTAATNGIAVKPT